MKTPTPDEVDAAWRSFSANVSSVEVYLGGCRSPGLTEAAGLLLPGVLEGVRCLMHHRASAMARAYWLPAVEARMVAPRLLASALRSTLETWARADAGTLGDAGIAIDTGNEDSEREVSEIARQAAEAYGRN